VNQINLVGRMTRDAEEFGNPPAGVRFTVVTEDYDPGQKARVPEFHDCKAFGQVKDVIKNYAGKGREVRVSGRYITETYTPQKGANAGIEQKRKIVIVNGNDGFELLAGMPSGATPAPASGSGGDAPLW
jgi:single-stranded DNA-binding protein